MDSNSTMHRGFSALNELLTYKPNNAKITAFHKSTSKTRLLLGGKRSGKSVASVVETCWAGLGIHPYLSDMYPKPPLSIRYCSVDFTSGIKGIILPLFKRFLGAFDDGPVVKKYWAEDRILELKNPFGEGSGSTIQMSSYDQDLEKFEGVSRDIIIMDEEPPLDVYQSNFMRTIDCAGKLIIACTPIHGLSWLYYKLYDNPDAIPPAVEHWHVKTSENPHVTAEEIEAVKKDPAMADNLEVALGGEFIPKSNLVFGSFGDESMLTSIVKPSEDDMVLVGIDPHDRNPWGVVFVLLNRENNYIMYDEILEAGTVTEIAPLIKSKLGSRRANLIVIDTSANTTQATSGKSIRDQLLSPYGLYCLDADKDVSAGILTINAALKDKSLKIGPNCVNIKRQFRSCFDDKTEVLTDDGWKLFKDLNRNELIATLNPKTWYLEYQKPTDYIENKYNGKMLLKEKGTTNFCVTPDHRMYGAGRYDYKSPDKFKLATIDKLPKSFMVKRNALWQGETIEYFNIGEFKIPIKDWLKFLGIYLAEGSVNQGIKHPKIETIISQSNKSKYFDEIKQCLENLPFNFKYCKKQFYTSNKLLYNYLLQFGKCRDKYIPKEFKNLSSDLLEYLLRGLMIGDGSIQEQNDKNNSRYKTISKQLSDDVEEIVLKAGRYGSLYIYKDTYQFTFSKNGGFSKVHDVQEIDYDGFVYCLTISNHIIYVRRSGHAMWSGQCMWEDWARNRNQRDPKERILKRDDHLLDAIRYVLMLPVVYRHPHFKVSPKSPDRVSSITGYY